VSVGSLETLAASAAGLSGGGGGAGASSGLSSGAVAGLAAGGAFLAGIGVMYSFLKFSKGSGAVSSSGEPFLRDAPLNAAPQLNSMPPAASATNPLHVGDASTFRNPGSVQAW
jgi:hypothetical protein